MDSATTARLLELNREFYTRFGDAFSATRQRIQPGVRRVLETLNGDESILDLGCGNGELARELAKRGHRGSYLGADFSLPLLRKAGLPRKGLSPNFLELDLSTLAVDALPPLLALSPFHLVLSFATLHHIPSRELRINILKAVRRMLQPDGLFIHSNWQFLHSEKLKARIQPWERASIHPSEVDAEDYLLDWRSGGEGLRYVHQFGEAELLNLASAAGFRITDSFYSDGATGDLGLYQVWLPD